MLIAWTISIVFENERCNSLVNMEEVFENEMYFANSLVQYALRN